MDKYFKLVPVLKVLIIKHLAKTQRYVMLNHGLKQSTIEKQLGVAASTVSRELKRNRSKRSTYNPEKVHDLANERKERFVNGRGFTKCIEKKYAII